MLRGRPVVFAPGAKQAPARIEPGQSLCYNSDVVLKTQRCGPAAAPGGGYAVIKKQDRLVITFFTTTDAMAMEHLCRARQADGRMIPVPRSISAGCGLAWCAAPESEKNLRALMESEGIRFQGVYRCLV